MTTTQDIQAPLRKEITVRCQRALAFEVFTARIASWWPLATHSVGEDQALSVSLDGRVGGQLVETCQGGETHVWGTITEWNPPHAFRCSWHPGRGAEMATALHFQFLQDGDMTRVVLEHSGWEILGERAALVRGNYDSGWDGVLGECFRRVAEQAAMPSEAAAQPRASSPA